MSVIGDRSWESLALHPNEYVSSKIYTDRDLFDEEIKRVKRATWKFACHESELEQINDFRTIDHSGIPIIVTRSDDGKIRAFVNSCSHRSALILREPCGNAKHWTCLFHLWTYNNRGACTQISREEGYANSEICKEKMSLREVRVGQKHGLVFVNLSDDAPSFEDYFGNAFEILEDVLSGAEYEVFHYHKAVVKGNWKQWHETNMELYHEYLHYVNRQVAMGGEGFFDREWKIYPYGHATLTPMVQKYERVKGWSKRDEKTLPGLKPGEFRILTLFPDTTILCRTTVIRIDTTNPISPDLTLVEQRGLGIKNERREDRTIRTKHHNQYWGPFGRNFPEDAIAVEAVNQSIRNGAPSIGIFARDENGRGQDDIAIRAYYDEWSRYMGRQANNPSNCSAS